MGEELAPARRLPHHRCAHRLQIDRGKPQAGLAREMLVQRLLRLRGRGEVDIAVLEVDRRTREHAFMLEDVHLLGGEDLVGGGVGHGRLLAFRFPGESRGPGLLRDVLLDPGPRLPPGNS